LKIKTATRFGLVHQAIFRLLPKRFYIQLTMSEKIREFVYLINKILGYKT